VNQEDSEQNEVDRMKKGADSTGKVMHYVKEQLVICNEEDTDADTRRLRLRSANLNRLTVPRLARTIGLRYDTIGEFNVDSKAEYSALSSTRSQKKKLKQTNNASAPTTVAGPNEHVDLMTCPGM